MTKQINTTETLGEIVIRVTNIVYGCLDNLFERWHNERGCESFKDYEDHMAKKFANIRGVKYVSMRSEPFSVTWETLDGHMFITKITAEADSVETQYLQPERKDLTMLEDHITKEQAVTLSYREVLEHKTKSNADGTPMRCRVNGKCKTWKTRPEDYRLPVKYGMYQCFYITPENAEEWYQPITDPGRPGDPPYGLLQHYGETGQPLVLPGEPGYDPVNDVDLSMPPAEK